MKKRWIKHRKGRVCALSVANLTVRLRFEVMLRVIAVPKCRVRIRFVLQITKLRW